MSITAQQLSKSGARGKELDALVREQLQIIDEKLLHADRAWGRNVVTYELPLNFVLPGLDKKDAQRIAYSSIIRSLDQRGFEVKILLEPSRSALYVAWLTDLNQEEVDAMNALIRQKRMQPSEVAAFLQPRERAAAGAPGFRASGRAESRLAAVRAAAPGGPEGAERALLNL